jgi:hypothetical protein
VTAPARLLRLSSLRLTATERDDLMSDLAKASHLLVLAANCDHQALDAFNDHLQKEIAAKGFPPTIVFCVGADAELAWVTPEALRLEADPAIATHAVLIEMRDMLCDLMDLNIPEVDAVVNDCIDLLNYSR